MLFARVVLGFTGLVFLVHGAVCFIQPDTIGMESGLTMPTPYSVIEVRAEYGGLPMALGIFFLAAAMKRIDLRFGLLIMVTVLTGYATARVIAVVLNGDADLYNTSAIIYEVTSLVLGIFALRATSRGVLPAGISSTTL